MPRWTAMPLLLAGAVACSREPAAIPTAREALPSKSEWRVECRPVKDDRYQACYGPGWDAQRAREPGRYHFYQVSVEQKQPSDAPLVLFVKRLAIEEVDARLRQETPVAEVARYDAATRSVRFDLGAASLVFPLAPVR
jgi:hypothetical protein